MVPAGEPDASPFVKVLFPLSAEEHGEDFFGAEGIWCEHLGEGRYRVDNIPPYGNDIALDDIVTVQPNGLGGLELDHVVERVGHVTVRLAPSRQEDVRGMASRFGALGFRHAIAYNLLTIDVPPDADIPLLIQVVEDGIARGAWIREPGPFDRLRDALIDAGPEPAQDDEAEAEEAEATPAGHAIDEAFTALGQDRWKRALRAAWHARTGTPTEQAQGIYVEALALGRLDHPRRSLRRLDRVLALLSADPDLLHPDFTPDLHMHRSYVLAVLGLGDEALAESMAAIAVLDGATPSPSLLATHAKALLAVGRPEEALDYADAALVGLPGSDAAEYLRARALAGSGRHDEAVASLRRALAIWPELLAEIERDLVWAAVANDPEHGAALAELVKLAIGWRRLLTLPRKVKRQRRKRRRNTA
ncbi:MAG: DUF4265 domain-containing protein [Chloroflexota bacterium]